MSQKPNTPVTEKTAKKIIDEKIKPNLVDYIKHDLKSKDLAKQVKQEAALAEQAEDIIRDVVLTKGLKEVNTQVTVSGVSFSTDIEVVGQEVRTVDVRKLYDLCEDKELFLKVVSATQKAVTDILGNNLLDQCLVATYVGDKMKIKYNVIGNKR